MEHRILTEGVDDVDGRSYWQCSCGHSGSCEDYRSDLASDKHIKYELGETRVDVNKLD